MSTGGREEKRERREMEKTRQNTDEKWTNLAETKQKQKES